jgi:D-alanyl-D-alanine carboxypeptidase
MSLLAGAALLLLTTPLIDTATIDSALARSYGSAAPGASVAVVRHGSIVFAKSYGLANLETHTALGQEMAIPIGSVTKPFTALAIMTLVRDGKLRLADQLHAYVPEMTKAGAVTIDQLLTHSSGIKSFTDLPAWQDAMGKDPETGVDAGRVLSMIAGEDLAFTPGSRDAYSNSDYFLLGKIVEKISGTPYEEYVRAAVLQPAGMAHTYCASPRAIAPVIGYRKRGTEFKREPFLGPAECRGGGGLASTAVDLGRWNQILTTDIVLPATLRAQMLAPATLTTGPGSYARGWQVWDHDGHRYLWHGGYTWGFIGTVVHDVDADVTVALVSNNVSPVEELDAQYLTKRLALMAAGRGGVEPAAVTVPEDTLARYAGLYTDTSGAQRKVTVHGGHLFAQSVPGTRYEIFGETPTRFFFKNSFDRLTFTIDATGRVSGMTEDGEEAPVTWKRTGDLPVRAPIAVPTAVLDTYVGEYEIRPGNRLVITRDGDRLFGQPTGGLREPFLATTTTNFFIESADTEFTFVSDSSGKVTSVLLHEPGWQLEAKRVNGSARP